MPYAYSYSALWTMISNISFHMSKDSPKSTSYNNVAKKFQRGKTLDFCKYLANHKDNERKLRNLNQNITEMREIIAKSSKLLFKQVTHQPS